MHESEQQKTFSIQLTRRDFLSKSLIAGAASLSTALLPKLKTNAESNYNVLFITVDDLRPLLGCYRHSVMHTPNIDKLAERGTLFNRAYCQFPVCNPSRASVLTGLRPSSTGVLHNSDDFLETVPDAVTLPHHFKIHGYHTRSVGKVAHGSPAWNDEHSWSVPIWRERFLSIEKGTSPSWKALDVSDDELQDGRIARTSVDVLAEIKDRRFFLAVGFNKPHLPFYAPRRYFDLYTSDSFTLPTDSSLPSGSPEVAGNLKAIHAYEDITTAPPLSNEKTLELTHAYAANVSFIDAQVGRILDQMDVLGLTENTIIVFWGDHGFHLGEHGMWRKNTLFEDAIRSPLIISIPGQKHNNVSNDSLVELVDIYPTLCDLCQIPIPLEVEGQSMVPLIDEPTHPWKTAAFTQLRRRIGNSSYIDGHSIRTTQYRYTEWGKNGERGIELYDYYSDPDETVNIADYPENEKLVSQFREQLNAGWQSALPEIHDQIFIPQTLPWDINNDGVVDLQDLILISSNFGSEAPETPKVDVNKDGIVDIIDLLIVATHYGESTNTGAPTTKTKILEKHLSFLDKWLNVARLADDGSNVFKQGIGTLERLLNFVIPDETKLLPNFPNPFNPDTWIPYDLAQDTDVNIQIFNLKGESIRELSLGFQTSGTYRSQAQAAYWDGRNSEGELVASGVYFYMLGTNQVKVTRQMVIKK